LGLRGEQQWLVMPLPVPNPERLPSLSELAQYPAVLLFIERARAAQSSFALTSRNAAAVVAICRRLDGLPLALELAAIWVKMISPKALLARLERRLSILIGGASDIPERQRTLHDTVSWSYNLLSSVEKVLFRRLTVFVGGFTVAAVDSVCRAGDETGGSLFDHVAALLDKNLLFQPVSAGGEQDDESRFDMLETIREYGLECLAEVGELGMSRERHAAYYLAMADSEMPVGAGAFAPSCPARLDPEFENVRAALEYRRSLA
jgi:predicted ATPase